MKSIILKALNVEPEEASRVYFLLAQGFFMGIFLATYSVASTALFISRFDEEIDLPYAILFSGVVGIVVTSLYAFFQTKIRFKNLARASLLIITGLVGATFYGIEYAEDNSQVVYAAFVFTIPFASISLLVFWGIFGRIFDLRQAKRIIGGIDTGQLIASILALFGVGFIVNSGIIESDGLYLFSGISAFLLFVTVTILSIRFDFQRKTAKGKVELKQFSFIKIAKHRYIRLMASFVVVSLIAAFFVDYSFLNVTSIQFETEQELASFIALFEATVVIFSFLFQTFVTDWVIANYGLRIALIVNPILIGLFTIIAILVGLVIGYSEGVENFVYFFLIIAMSKLFIDSIKDALDGPSFKLYFLPIDPEVKFDVQTKIEGVVTAFAGVVAGGLIILINYLQLDLIYITIFLAPLLAFWAYNVVLMYKQYRVTLQSALAENKHEHAVEQKFHINKSLDSGSIDSDTDVISSLKIMERVDPAVYESSVSNLIKSDSERVKGFATTVSNKLQLDPALNTDVRELALEALGASEKSNLLSITSDQLYHLSRSYKKSNRLLAAKLLRAISNDDTVFILIELLRDIEPEVKLEAIHAARIANRHETWGILSELLDSPSYGHAAASALVNAGSPVLEYLENQFHRSGQSRESQLMIVEIMGRIGTDAAIELLWKKIDYPDRKIVRQILETFENLEYLAGVSQTIKLTELLEDEISKAIWNLAAIGEISEKDQHKLVRQALEYEVVSNYDFIYLLLGLMYDRESVDLVRSNIEADTGDSTAYALELMDIFLAKGLKPKLFALFDDISTDDKLKRLQEYYPRESYSEQQVLNYILHRDFNAINRWTKACALEALAKDKTFKLTKGVVAHLFNPDKMIAQSAARILYKNSRGTYESISRRLDEETKKELDHLLLTQNVSGASDDPYPFDYDKTCYLLSIPEFEPLLPVIVSQIASKTSPVFIPADQTLILDSDTKRNRPITIVAKGSVQLRSGNDPIATIKRNELCGDLFMLDNEAERAEVYALEDTVVYTISNNDFFLIVSNYPELAKNFVKGIAEKLEEEITKN